MPLSATARRVRGNRTQTAHIPAPVGGLNTIDAGFQLPDTDAVLLYNLIAAENGVRVRLGYKEWCTGIGVGVVPSIIPFNGSKADGTNDRLFATSGGKIYPVGTSAASPASVFTFASSAGDTGWGIFRGIVNSVGNHFLAFCDEVNGYHMYSESTVGTLTADTWAAISSGAGAQQVSGIDPAKFCFVAVWKNWVLFVEKDSSRMWVSNTTRSPFGALTSWDFGAQFPHGGNLVGLWSATGNLGNGIDDYLVAISSSGDVVLYQGTDPNDATKFGIAGVYFVGGVPAGRRIATDFGGDLLILATRGVVPLSRLVTGVDYTNNSLYATQKIGNLFNTLVSQTGTIKGWSLRVHPEEAAILITVPVADGQPTTQLAMSDWSRGWFRYRGLPIVAAETWKGKFYFGTADGRVCVGTGYQDNVARDGSTYSTVQFSGITAFRNGGRPTQKQVQQIRATYLYQGGLLATTEQARFRYDLTEAAAPNPVTTNTSNVFDTAQFDIAVFAGDYATQQVARGAAGMGPDVAIAFAGSTNSRTVLVGIDVVFTEGGIN